ncbi:hypothetical protein VTK56DRAFT_2974 [Thermocarpiscus australiensis]
MEFSLSNTELWCENWHGLGQPEVEVDFPIMASQCCAAQYLTEVAELCDSSEISDDLVSVFQGVASRVAQRGTRWYRIRHKSTHPLIDVQSRCLRRTRAFGLSGFLES